MSEDDNLRAPRRARLSVTSKKIAQLAGVSQPTVSRVINAHPRVREETRQRVLGVIDSLGYAPNITARSLVTRRSYTIGLVVSNIVNPFYPEFIDAVNLIAAENGLSVLLCNPPQGHAREQAELRALVEQQVGGIIITSVMRHSPHVVELLHRGYPIVLVNRYLADVKSDAVLIDNYAGAALAVNHLLRLGHRRIAYVRGIFDTTTNWDRERGYRDTLSRAGISVDEALVLPGDYAWAGAYQAGVRFLALNQRPTAALCADDLTAFGFMDALYDANLAVPQDCAVIGFDDVRTASYRTIALTTVRQPVRAMAAQAMRLLLERMGDDGLREPRQIVFPAELIVRRTCGANGRLSLADMPTAG